MKSLMPIVFSCGERGRDIFIDAGVGDRLKFESLDQFPFRCSSSFLPVDCIKLSKCQ